MFVVIPVSFQKMVTLVFPLYSLILTIFIMLLPLCTSNGDHHKYKTCSSSSFSCGNLQNVGYPFWGGERPQYCGHPALQLECDRSKGEEHPVLKIGHDDDDQNCYYVRDILSYYPNMIIQLGEFPKGCLVHSFSKKFSEIFRIREPVVNITLFHECQVLHMADVLHCSVPCWDKQNARYYYRKKTPGTKQFEEELGGCKQFQVSVLQIELDQLFSNHNPVNIRKQGFKVEYLNSSACSTCENSGGICGSNGTQFACFHGKSGVEQWKLIVGLAIPGFLILVSLNVGCWCCLKQRFYSPMLQSSRFPSVPMNSDLENGSSFHGIPVLPYGELQEATSNFDESQKIGDGGFGIVYYGKLEDGREVAVKRLYEKNYKQIGQFMNEIEILTRLRHPNLVTLHGCTSSNSRELLLVYEFIPNGTVSDHLYGERKGSETLSWDVRMKIATGTASALSYLHASDTIHRDVKTHNILLDNSFTVKVADFGLSRLFPCDATHVSTVPQGTPGYLDPQYHKNYQVTNKSDVYSFGVVLVELISSLPAVDISRREDEINLYDYAVKRIQHGMLSELVDQKLGFESDFKVNRMVTLVAELAFRCLQQENELRPTMDEVLAALEEIASTDYEALKAEDRNRSKSASRLTSMIVEDHVIEPPSPNSVIVSWVSKSSASNISS